MLAPLWLRPLSMFLLLSSLAVALIMASDAVTDTAKAHSSAAAGRRLLISAVTGKYLQQWGERSVGLKRGSPVARENRWIIEDLRGKVFIKTLEAPSRYLSTDTKGHVILSTDASDEQLWQPVEFAAGKWHFKSVRYGTWLPARDDWSWGMQAAANTSDYYKLEQWNIGKDEYCVPAVRNCGEACEHGVNTEKCGTCLDGGIQGKKGIQSFHQTFVSMKPDGEEVVHQHRSIGLTHWNIQNVTAGNAPKFYVRSTEYGNKYLRVSMTGTIDVEKHPDDRAQWTIMQFDKGFFGLKSYSGSWLSAESGEASGADVGTSESCGEEQQFMIIN